ncbi:MAG: TolC family protein [Desulfobacterales bacterium]
MKINGSPKILFLCVFSLGMALIGGCTPVDRWGVFTPDYKKAVKQTKQPGTENPDRYQPRMKEAIAIDAPEPNQPLALSIEDAIVRALENNRDLRIQQLNPVITGTFERIERGIYDPEIFAEFEYTEETATQTSRATGEEFSVDATNARTAAGLQQALPSGTTLEATVEQARDQSNRAPNQRTARVGLSITQSLLRGFGPAVNLVSIRQAELDTLASTYELRGFTESLVADTETAYWNYVLAHEEISIYESSLAVARKQRDEIEEQITVGLLPETEAAAARAEVARREQALIDARSSRAERRLRLIHLIYAAGGGRFENKVKATSKPAITPQPITDPADRLALAEKSRPDLNEARLRLKQGRLETIATRNGILPKLDLFVDFGRTGYGDSFSAAFRELNENTYDSGAGLRLSHYLKNRTAEARHEAAWHEQQQAKRAVDNLRQMVELDVRLAINEVARTWQQIAASRATRQLEEQTLRAENQRFEVGASTALLVAQAQRDLLIAQIAEVRAITNYRIALVNLYLAEGSLLERRGISIGNRRADRF